jgi:hypothetical protein
MPLNIFRLEASVYFSLQVVALPVCRVSAGDLYLGPCTAQSYMVAGDADKNVWALHRKDCNYARTC